MLLVITRALLIGAILALILAWADSLRAANWHWLQLCRHDSGEPLQSLNFGGVKTLARSWIDMDQVDMITPLEIQGCVRVEFRDGTSAVVFGKIREIQCMIQRGPGCENE